MRQRASLAVLVAPLAIGLCFVFGYAVTYITADPSQFGIYRARHDWLYLHILAGMVALLSGPFQLWLGLNRRTAIFHRILGIFYVLAVLTSATAAFYLARHTDFGWVFGLGFGSMAFVWVVTTILATIAICLRRVEQHREWMIRSYVVTFAFVTYRILDGALDTFRVGMLVDRLTAAVWMSWTLPLFITESILQARKIFMKPVIAARAPEPSGLIVAPEQAAFDLRSSGSSYQHQR
jgi:hypothetical protein